MDYDESRIYYSYQNLQTNQDGNNNNSDGDNDVDDNGGLDFDKVNLNAVKRHFREFLSELKSLFVLFIHTVGRLKKDGTITKCFSFAFVAQTFLTRLHLYYCFKHIDTLMMHNIHETISYFILRAHIETWRMKTLRY